MVSFYIYNIFSISFNTFFDIGFVNETNVSWTLPFLLINIL